MSSINEDIQFQILDWNEYTIDQDISEDKTNSDEEENTLTIKKYAIRLFGKTKDNKSICCDVKEFTPFFFVKLDKEYIN